MKRRTRLGAVFLVSIATVSGLTGGEAMAATTTYWSTANAMQNWGSIGVSSAGFITYTGHGIRDKSTPLWTHYTAIWTTGATPIHILNGSTATHSTSYPAEASTRAGCSNQSGGTKYANCRETTP